MFLVADLVSLINSSLSFETAGKMASFFFEKLIIVPVVGGGGGGGTLKFSWYEGLAATSTVYPQKYQEYQAYPEFIWK